MSTNTAYDALEYRTIKDKSDKFGYPSDHYPIMARLKKK